MWRHATYVDVMSRPTPSPSIRLAEVVLGQDLGEWVQDLRNDERSWSYIARKLAEKTNEQVTLSGSYLRRLYGPPAAA